jgi:hypothetical protein
MTSANETPSAHKVEVFMMQIISRHKLRRRADELPTLIERIETVYGDCQAGRLTKPVELFQFRSSYARSKTNEDVRAINNNHLKGLKTCGLEVVAENEGLS